jgi:hypothetical protein
MKANTLPVEVIMWRDAFFSRKTVMDSNLARLVTVGFVVYEDDEKVILAYEIEKSGEFRKKEMDYTAIPKALIEDRRAVARVRFQADGSLTPPRRRKTPKKEVAVSQSSNQGTIPPTGQAV